METNFIFVYTFNTFLFRLASLEDDRGDRFQGVAAYVTSVLPEGCTVQD